MRKPTIAIISIVMMTSAIGCGTSRKDAIALLRLRPTMAESAPQGDPVNYEVFCQTQVELIQSPFVLNAALKRLREQGIQIPVENTTSPIDDIKARLTTSRPGKSEILRVSFAGRNASDSVAILDAVIDAYLEEVVALGEKERIQRLSLLRSEHRKQTLRLTESLEMIHSLEAELGSSNTDADQVEETLKREQLAAAARRVEKLRDELISAQIDQRAIRTIGDEATPEQIAAGNLASARADAISELLASQEATLEKLVEQRQSVSRFSADLLTKKAELQVLEQNVQALAAEISRFELQSQEPGLVSLAQPAIIP
jgi:hypothetical protein